MKGDLDRCFVCPRPHTNLGWTWGHVVLHTGVQAAGCWLSAGCKPIPLLTLVAGAG